MGGHFGVQLGLLASYCSQAPRSIQRTPLSLISTIEIGSPTVVGCCAACSRINCFTAAAASFKRLFKRSFDGGVLSRTPNTTTLVSIGILSLIPDRGSILHWPHASLAK